MASVFKRGRWVDENGRKCRKDAPGATWRESRVYTVRVYVDGATRTFKGYTDRQASEQLGAKLERAKGRGEMELLDPYQAHRGRPLAKHVADWITELRQNHCNAVYVRLCEARMARLLDECRWGKLADISAAAFLAWRETATVEVGTARKAGSNIRTMGARTQNHYLATLRTFCLWAVRRKRMAANPVADAQPVSTAGKLRRQRRALHPDEIAALLQAVPERHRLAYRLILATGLRRDELRQLRWGDVLLNAPHPCIQLRAETTKAKRADVLPVRADLAALLKEARGDAGDMDPVLQTLPTMDSHKRYLRRAGIDFTDEQGRRADFHALRHTFGTMLAAAGVAPRVAMSLMRHTDMRLTQSIYVDPKVFDLSGAVAKLPSIDAGAHVDRQAATGTDGRASADVAEAERPAGARSGRTESVTSRQAQIGYCSAVIGRNADRTENAITPGNGMNWHEKTPSGKGGEKQRAKGVETYTPSAPAGENAIECPENPHVSEPAAHQRPAGAPKASPVILPQAGADADLQAVVDAWPDLPADVRKMISGVVRLTPKTPRDGEHA